jgi:hypothetical protein
METALILSNFILGQFVDSALHRLSFYYSIFGISPWTVKRVVP